MVLDRFSLSGKVALVTGGRRGIGRTIALAYAEAGADIALCDIVLEDGALKGVAKEIESFGRRAMIQQADTSKKKDVEILVDNVIKEFGAIDILVNNAGIILRSTILEMDEKDWDRLFEVDLKGYFLCAQAVGKRMIERREGVIINIASQFAFKVSPMMGPYAIVKAGVVMLTRALAQELGPYGIRANAIAPSMVRTEFSRQSWSDPENLKKIEASIPIGRVAETDDLIGAALLLASDAGRYITGHTLVVDGGILA